MDTFYFGHILRTTMIDHEMSPSLLAEKVGVSAETVAKWLRGESFPKGLQIAKILLSTSKHHYELAEIAAQSRYRKIAEMAKSDNLRPYDFQDIFMRITADAAVSSKLSEEERSKLFKIFERISTHAHERSVIPRPAEDTSSLSELIILPKPSIIC